MSGLQVTGESDRGSSVAAGPLSLRAYARHRGTSVEAVRRAIKSQRLVKCLVAGADGSPKIADPALADAEWAGNTDLSKAPTFVKEREGTRVTAVTPTRDTRDTARDTTSEPEGEPSSEEQPELSPGMSLNDATKADKYWSAMTRKLEYEKQIGELVSAKRAGEFMTNVFALSRTKLLALPSKARAALPHLTHADIGTLDRLIREALEDLANQTPSSNSPAVPQ